MIQEQINKQKVSEFNKELNYLTCGMFCLKGHLKRDKYLNMKDTVKYVEEKLLETNRLYLALTSKEVDIIGQDNYLSIKDECYDLLQQATMYLQSMNSIIKEADLAVTELITQINKNIEGVE